MLIGDQSISGLDPRRRREIERGEEGERRKNWRVSSCHTQTMMVMTETEEGEAERGAEREGARSLAHRCLRPSPNCCRLRRHRHRRRAAPAALLSEIRRVIARLRLHLPAHAPSPGAWRRRICYSLFHSYACACAFLCLSLMFQNTTLPFMRCNLAFEVDVEWRARERERRPPSLPLSLLSCLLHACSLPRSLARSLPRSFACL